MATNTRDPSLHILKALNKTFKKQIRLIMVTQKAMLKIFKKIHPQ